MQDDDAKRLMSTLLGAHSFYGAELSALAAKVWIDAMRGFDIGDIERAFAAHLRDPDHGRWMPKPADIIRQIRGNADEQAAIAWGRVLGVATGRDPSNLDDVAQQAIDAVGGIAALKRADESQNGFFQKRFCDAYRAFAQRKALADATPGVGLIGGRAMAAIKGVA